MSFCLEALRNKTEAVDRVVDRFEGFMNFKNLCVVPILKFVFQSGNASSFCLDFVKLRRIGNGNDTLNGWIV